MTLDIKKLIKLMRMTESSYDAEALTALRMANAMLGEEGINWEDIFNVRASILNDVAAKTPPKGKIYTDKGEIDGYFSLLQNQKLGSFGDFVFSVHEFWLEREYLTEKQYKVIKDAADRRNPIWKDI